MDYLVISYNDLEKFLKEQMRLARNRTLDSAVNEAISNMDDLFEKKGIKTKLEKGDLK
jgi:hypothetical protein